MSYIYKIGNTQFDIEMTEQQMLDLDDEDYEAFCKWRAERAKM